MNIIKQITKKELDALIASGVIGTCNMYGNDSFLGKHSSGYYDVQKYLKAKKENPDMSERYLKNVEAHVGVSITKNHKIYIEDSYIK